MKCEKSLQGRLVRESKYKLDLIAVREVRRDKGATEPAGKMICFLWKEEWEL
jgi:hypothetical protein